MSAQTTMTFPCPACGAVISLSGNQAVGPCPYCHSELQAIFSVNIIQRQQPDGGPTEKGYDARCFRPDGRAPEQTWRSHTPSAQ